MQQLEPLTAVSATDFPQKLLLSGATSEGKKQLSGFQGLEKSAAQKGRHTRLSWIKTKIVVYGGFPCKTFVVHVHADVFVHLSV